MEAELGYSLSLQARHTDGLPVAPGSWRRCRNVGGTVGLNYCFLPPTL